MAAYHAELLDAAMQLIARQPRQSGRLPAARIRRSISTCYYALFHFLLDDACRRIVRNEGKHLRRRRIVTRVFTHKGIKTTMNKIRGRSIDESLSAFVQPTGVGPSTKITPAFARNMASVFIDAQAKRHNADYDLNVSLSEMDARRLNGDCRDAIRGWQKAMKADERDFKNALSIVMLLKGQLRSEE
jgi:hypothetical protein